MKRRAGFPNKSGFTLIELLITSSIMAIISGAVIAAFAGGLRVFERARSYGGLQPDVLLSLEKLERDLANSVDLEGIPFKGEKEKVSFPAVTGAGLGRITYEFDGVAYLLLKREEDYSRAISQESYSQPAAQPLAQIESLDFSYYYYEPKTQSYQWREVWESPEAEAEEGEEEEYGFLLGVRVRLGYKQGRNTQALERMVFLPVQASAHQARLAKETKK